MSSPKPTLGYHSRTAAIEALRADGLDTKAIARRIGIDRSQVTALEASARRDRSLKTERPTRPFITGLYVEIDRAAGQRLRPHAARRGVSVDTLVRRIVDAALDGMIDAVLDDADELQEHAA